jgi:phage/conjugal plasmid C-4 type zinc finger TraR family protein
MTDIFDRASEHEANARDDAIKRQQRHSSLAGKTVQDSARECAVCECAIPEARRSAVPGVQTCVRCQEDLERAVNYGSRGKA